MKICNKEDISILGSLTFGIVKISGEKDAEFS
jgi:hypothetical protein